MSISKLCGKYKSRYIAKVEGVPTIIEDHIWFEPSQPTEVVGNGERDDDGALMRLFLHEEGDRIAGTWREEDATGKALCGGTVDFGKLSDTTLIGWWHLQEGNEQNSEISKGAWMLMRLGNTAISA